MTQCYYPELCEGVSQCYTCSAYERGILAPEHPVPAIIYKLTITPDEDVDHHHSVILWQVETICDCCGGMTGFVAAAWDFDAERASCYFLPLGKYVNSADIIRGVHARAELDKDGSQLQ